MSSNLVGSNASFDGMVHIDNMTAFSVRVEGALVTQHLSMQVRKLQVVGELYLSGINGGERLNEMNDLERRLEALEKLVANL